MGADLDVFGEIFSWVLARRREWAQARALQRRAPLMKAASCAALFDNALFDPGLL